MNSKLMYQPKPIYWWAAYIVLAFPFLTTLAPDLTISRSAGADAMNPGVFSIDSKPYGISYSEWTAKWWQWIISIPEKDNPNLDFTGEKCSLNQNDSNVMFLAPTFGGSATRECTMPQGKAIFFPVLTGECDYLTEPTIKTEPELLKCAMSVNEGGVVRVTVDGVELKNLEKYRVQSPLFDLTMPLGTAFEGPVGKTKGIADGYYIFLEPLSPGKHTIQFSGSVVDNPTTGTTSYATAVTYNINVR
jgi:hypothetical protein